MNHAPIATLIRRQLAEIAATNPDPRLPGVLELAEEQESSEAVQLTAKRCGVQSQRFQQVLAEHQARLAYLQRGAR